MSLLFFYPETGNILVPLSLYRGIRESCNVQRIWFRLVRGRMKVLQDDIVQTMISIMDSLLKTIDYCSNEQYIFFHT